MSGSGLLSAYAPAGPTGIRAGDRLASLLAQAFDRAGVEVRDGDVLAISAAAVGSAAGLAQTCADAAQFRTLVDAASRRRLAERSVHGELVSVDLVPGGDEALVDAGLLRPASFPGTVVTALPDPPTIAAALRSSLRGYFRADIGIVLVTPDLRPGAAAGALRPLSTAGRVAAPQASAAAAALVLAADRPAAVVRTAEGPSDDHATSVTAVGCWFQPAAYEAARAAIGAHAIGQPAPSADAADDVGVRVERALDAVRQGAGRIVGEDAWTLDTHGAGSVVTIAPAPQPARSGAGGHPLLEATIGLGALCDRVLCALRIEGLHGDVDLEWGATGAPIGARIPITVDTHRTAQ